MTPPLTPPDCDLRGLEYMPLLGQHLFGSEFNARANDSEWRAALTLWWAAWCQVPAASLPDDDIALCRFADLGRDVKAWKKVRENALHGWIKCDDGRLYHPVLAKQALLAWDKRQADRVDRTATSERKARERAARSRMFEQLAEVGVTPDWNIRTSELRQLVTDNCTETSHGNHTPVTPPVTRNVTAKTGRDGTGREKEEEDNNLPPSDDARAAQSGGGGGYAFIGTTIRLTKADFDRWKVSYHAILDLRAELTGIDDWLQSADESTRKRWFHAVSRMLGRKHEEALSAKSAGKSGDSTEAFIRRKERWEAEQALEGRA